MPDLNPADIRSLFAYMESEAPPNTESSTAVGMWLHFLKSFIGGQAKADGDGRRADFRQSFFPGYQPDSRTCQAMASACAGDHSKWATALLGQAVYNAVPGSRSLLNYDKLTAAVQEMNAAFANNATKLYIEYFRVRGVAVSEANRNAYMKLLLSPQWRTATALKQKSGEWRNPSWEMYCHWVKLSACWGKNTMEVRKPAGNRKPSPQRRGLRPRLPGDDRMPPPFLDDGEVYYYSVFCDEDVNRVYHELQDTEPKIDLRGFPDIAPEVWTNYRAWSASGPIGHEMLGARTDTKYRYVSHQSAAPGQRGVMVNHWADRYVAEDFAGSASGFR
jgi:hypothetical protein